MLVNTQELSSLLQEFADQIETLRKGQKPKYSVRQVQILDGFTKESAKTDRLIALIESLLLRKISSTQVHLISIFIDKIGISFIAREKFQKLCQTLNAILSTNLQILAVPNIQDQVKQHINLFLHSLNILTYICLQKFVPIHIDRHIQETLLVHQLNRKIHLESTIDTQPSFPVEQSNTDGFFVQLNLIVKDILRKYSQVNTKENRDLKLKKLTSIVEQEGDLEQEEENEIIEEVLGEQNESELDEMLSQSMKISGHKVQYDKTLQYGGISEEQKNLKISLIAQVFELQNEILQFIQSKKPTIIEFELLTYQRRELQKLSTQLVKKNRSISLQVGQVLKMSTTSVSKQHIDQPITARMSFRLREFLVKPDGIFTEFCNFLPPIKDPNQIDQLNLVLCNFLNCKGGILLIGVMDANHQVVGIDIPKKEKEQFRVFVNKILASFQPSIEQEVSVDFVPISDIPNLNVIRVCVQQGFHLDKIYTFRNSKNEITSSFKEGSIQKQSQQEIIEEIQKFQKTLKKRSPKIDVSQITQENINEVADVTSMSSSSTIHQLVKLNKDRSNKEKALMSQNSLPNEKEKQLMTPEKIEKKPDDKSGQKFTASPLQMQKGSPVLQKQTQTHRIDISLFQNFEKESLLQICQQILGPFGQLTLQYQIQIPNNNTITVYTQEKKFYEGVKNRVFANFKELKSLKVVRKIKADMEGIFEISNVNQLQPAPIDKANIIMVIGYQQKYKVNLIQLLLQFLQLRKIEVIKFDTEFQNSITIITSNSEGLNQFLKGVSLNKDSFKQYGFEKILKFGTFAGSLSLSNLDEEILQYLNTLGYSGEKQLNNYIKYQIDNYRDCAKLYDYFFQLQSNQIRNGMQVNSVIGIVMNLNNSLMI